MIKGTHKGREALSVRTQATGIRICLSQKTLDNVQPQ